MQCTNNLKQIGLAMHGYLDVYKGFPTSITTAGNFQLRSALMPLLPYLDQQVLYAQWNQNQAWNAPFNQTFIDTPVVIFECPTDPNYLHPIPANTSTENCAIKVTAPTIQRRRAVPTRRPLALPN